MVVNSLNFLTFFVVVFLVYYLVSGKSEKMQNTWLLLSSYVFYGIAEWRMIPLLAVSTLMFYVLGRAIEHFNENNEGVSSHLTTLGICLGIGVLLYFKYLNFFIESFSTFFKAIGLNCDMTTFDILMPLGISFFTFKLIAYIIEIHRGHIAAERDIIAFGTYIAFFPTILSGPIDRPQKFLPQLQKARTFNYDLAENGCKQILWGMFKKMVISDVLTSALIVPTWETIETASAVQLILSALIYPLVMYADFSGYSDMAIGIGKLLGIKVAPNFKYPFFGRNIAEFWRNWHISLTSWLTDYVFMPLNIAFRNIGVHGSVLSIIITFVLIGMWHGANWTFCLFGLYHGLLYIPLMYNGAFFKRSKLKTCKWDLPTPKNFRQMTFTYMLVALGLILFYAPNVWAACDYVSHCVSASNWEVWRNIHLRDGIMAYISILAMLIFEWYHRNEEFALARISSHKVFNWGVCIAIVIAIIFYQGKPSEFIYFKF